MANVSRPRVTRQGFWGWLLQRVTGALLLFLVAAHLFYLHYALEWPITFQDVTGSAFLRAVDLGILVLVVYHALYGVRTALLSFGLRPRRGLTLGLFVLGGVTVAFGVLVFSFLLRG